MIRGVTELVIGTPAGEVADDGARRVKEAVDLVMSRPEIVKALAEFGASKAQLAELREMERKLHAWGAAAQADRAAAFDALVTAYTLEARGDSPGDLDALTDTFSRAETRIKANAEALRRTVERSIPFAILAKLKAERKASWLASEGFSEEATIRTKRMLELTAEAAEYNGEIALNLGAGVHGELLALRSDFQAKAFDLDQEYTETRDRFRKTFDFQF
jgi:hypothetical protein